MTDMLLDERLDWVASRFNAAVEQPDGDTLLYNSFMGAFARVPAVDSARLRDALHSGISGIPAGILAELCVHGFFVPSGTDEKARLDGLCVDEHLALLDRLQLVLLPNEQCNFRCKYCSQTFARKKMKRDVIEGVVALVARRAPSLKTLSVGWFGGEPRMIGSLRWYSASTCMNGSGRASLA